MKGYIYKIELGKELLYIGSTKQRLSRRKTGHKVDCFNKKSNAKLYKTLRDEYDITKENFNEIINLICVEVVEYNDKHELKAREAYYIKKLNPICNCLVPYDKKWDIKQYKKQYRVDNKEEIKLRKSKKIICCCGCIIWIDGIRRHKRSNKHINLLKERLDKKKLLHNELLN